MAIISVRLCLSPLLLEGVFYFPYLCEKYTLMGITIPGSSPTSATSVRYYRIGSVEYRQTIRDGKFVTDKLLSGGSWDGEQGPGDGTGDWENVGGVQ